MRQSSYGRVLIPLLTPFSDDFSIDVPRVHDLVEYVIGKKYCDSLIVCGTNGEFYALTYEERLTMFRTVKEAVGRRVPLIAGTGANNTLEVIALSQEAQELGYDALMILPPYFGNPTQEEIANHFLQIAAAVSVPIILYNIPLFTGVNISPDTTATLAKHDRIIAIKEEAGINPLQTTETLLRTPDDFAIFSGDDVMTLQVLVQGGSGVVSGGSHVVGDLLKDQIERFVGGDVDGANAVYLRSFPFFKALVPNTRQNPVPLTKAALRLAGIDVGRPRPPLLPPSEAEEELLKSAMRSLGKLA
jgi:4-hydroxy-tetrahydrodipicolinate synthase